jgi:hypothetical protein
MTSGPKRLSESSDELARSLGAARGHVPSPERLALIGERLAELGLPTTEPSGVKTTPEAAATPATPPPSSLLLKGIAGAVATGGVVLTLALTMSGQETTKTQAPTMRATAAATSAPAPERTAPSTSDARPMQAPRAPEPRSEPASAIPVEKPSVPAPSTQPPGHVAARSTTPRAVAEAVTAAPTTDAPPAVDAESPTPAAVAQRATTGEASAEPGELRRAPAQSEVELLKEARRVLSGDPERALMLTRRYGAEYPHGTYAQERDFIAISALVRLGRTAEAKSRGAAFRARYARSAYLPQLERLLGER